ncbi:MAG TPA: flagellar basal body-associated FliL family protein [Caulobacteraceae bacterium]|jgi:flagellar FliL protein|nr:flagellar basal body-associated FliL family protein [Caulobacteraceae bacterium]
MAKDVADKDADEELDEDAVEGEGEEEGKKKLPPRLIIIGAAAAAAVLVLGGGGTAAFLIFGHHAPAGAHAAKAKKAKKDGDKKDDKTGSQVSDGPDGVVFYTPPDIVANMDTADGKPTFLKLKLTFELPDHDTADTLDEDMPRLQDMFQTFLRELRPEDLTGSEGSYQLRMELLRRVNLIVAPAKVNTVLIEEMLIN